jgi:hypothetical protein
MICAATIMALFVPALHLADQREVVAQLALLAENARREGTKGCPPATNTKQATLLLGADRPGGCGKRSLSLTFEEAIELALVGQLARISPLLRLEEWP